MQTKVRNLRSRLLPGWREEGTLVALPLAAGLCMWVYAGLQVAPAAKAEGRYLALLATMVLLTTSSLAGPGSGLGRVWRALPVLVTAVVWILPAGPPRGAVVTLLLSAGLGTVALLRLSPSQGDLEWRSLVPAALGFQILLRGEALLVPLALDLRLLVTLLVLPLLSAGATKVLARHHGTSRALLAAATVLLLGSGWTAQGTFTLLALALVSAALEPRPSTHRWCSMLLGVATLASMAAWDPKRGLLVVVAALGVVGRPWSTVAAALPSAVTALVFASQPWPQAVAEMAWILVLLPLGLLPSPGRSWKLAAAAPVALAGARVLPGPQALVPAMALVALAVADRNTSPVAALQRLWTGALLVATLALSAYPWLRTDPLVHALHLVGLSLDTPSGGSVGGVWSAWSQALGVAGLLIVLGVAVKPSLPTRLGRRFRSPQLLSQVLGSVILLLALLLELPGRATVLIAWPQVVLSQEQPSFTVELPPAGLNSQLKPEQGQIATVVMDSALAHGLVLPAGTQVATLRLVLEDGSQKRWSIRVGTETGEWAADRIGSFVPGDPRVPQPWLSWVHGQPNGDGSGGPSFLGRRYRARWRLGEPQAGRRLEVALEPDLPAPITLTLFHLALRGGGID